MIRTGSAAAFVIAATFATAGPAPASVPYDVYGCRLPDGSPAPAEGWTPLGANARIQLAETCRNTALSPEGRALYGRFGGLVLKQERARWAFFAPRDTRIANLTLWRAAKPSTGTGVAYWSLLADASAPNPGPELEQCMTYQIGCPGLGSLSTALIPANRVDFSALRASEVDAMLICAGLNEAYPCDTVAEFKVYGARIGLLDEAAPELGAPDGSLADSQSVQEGTKSLVFSAADRGGGIATVGLIVDGVERATTPADPLSIKCRQPYTTPVPCPLAVDATVPLDTASLSDGPHEVAAFATDVSGNRTTSAAFRIVTRNASFPNGGAATRDARLTAALTTVKGRRISRPLGYGTRAVLGGTLTTAAGAAIAGARIDIAVRSSRPGAAPHARFATTDANGRFVYRLPVGSSRQIDVGYRAFSLDAAFAATASTKLRVRAGTILAVSPRTLRNGQQVRFHGRLRGGPHRRDASMILYALAARGRIPVTSLRADSRGRISFRYRFRTVTSTSRFRFEVQVESRPSYPYASGRSNVVTVVVRP